MVVVSAPPPKARPTIPAAPREPVEEAYDRHAAALYRYARLLAGTGADAEDLVQAAFVAMVKESRLGRPIKDERAFLYTVVHNEAMNVLRKRDLWREKVSDSVQRFVEARLETGSGLDGETVDALNKALARLPLEQREALGLRYFEALGMEEVAEVMGVPKATATSRCRLGLAKLREYLKPHKD